MTNADAGEVRITPGPDGAPLQYEVLGGGEPVVFLHGAYASRYAWSRQRPLAQHFRLVLRDLRGHDGAPSAAPPDFGFDTTEVADMLAVLDAEGIGRAHIVGHSTGGTIALSLTLKHPERVSRLVLIEPTFVSQMSDEMYEPLKDDFESMSDEEMVSEAMQAIFGEQWRSRVSTRALARMQAMAPINRAHGLAQRRRRDVDEGIASLKAPALFLYGELGVWPPNVRQSMRSRYGLDVRVIPGAGHNAHVDQPDAVNAAVLDFLRKA